MKTMTKLTDINGVEIQVGQECEAYNDERGIYFSGNVVGIKDEFASVEDMNGDVFDIEPYNIEIEIDLRHIAEEEGFDIIETTTGTNGYPRNLKHAIVGFENFEDAKDLAEKYGLNVESFRKKDGWQLWNRDNANMYAPYLNSASKFGDVYEEYSKMDEEEFFETEINYNIDNFQDFDSLNKFISNKKEIWEEIENMEDDEIVITCYGDYHRTIKRESMEFSHDTWNYVIGVI